MNLSIADIEEYLSIVRQAVREDRYEIERNENREENLKLSWQYMLPEEDNLQSYTVGLFGSSKK